MTYIPHTDADRLEMLKAIGVEKMEDLFKAVPARVRFPKLDLPPASSEMEVWWEMSGLSEANYDLNHYACFLGAGAYNHYTPHTVDHVLRRSEFYTAYTPYQPEISQGTLQAMFEYQSMVCQLTGMDVSNASHYDGATSLAEGVLLARAEREHVTAFALGIDGLADEAAGHLAHVSILRGKDAQARPAEGQRDAERLAFGAHHVGTILAWRLE